MTADVGTWTCTVCGSSSGGDTTVCSSCGSTALDTHLRLGAIVDNKYQLIAALGGGGMGVVFKARHLDLKATRCIKFMRPGLTGDRSLRKRFQREGIAATKLHHPNIAAVHDFAKLEDGSYYLVYEFVEGVSLRQWLGRHGRVPSSVAILIALQVLEGLQHCHERGVLHRDISPQNVMIGVNNEGALQAKIIDLGVAKMPNARPGDATVEGLFVGNPKYSSPEQFGMLQDGEEIDARSDLYSLSVVLFEIITGQPPFSSRSAEGFAAKHLTNAAPSFAEVAPDLGPLPELERVIETALCKDRRLRYGSAAEFAAALRSAAQPAGDELRQFTDAVRAWQEEKTSQPEPILTLATAATVHSASTLHTKASSQARTVLRARKRWPYAMLLGIGAAMIGPALYFAPFRNRGALPLSTSAVQVVAPSGRLMINASPWAEVVSIRNVAHGEFVRRNERQYTPVLLTLPEGRYDITLTHPAALAEKRASIDVKTGQTAACVVDFSVGGSQEYLARALP